MPKECGTFLKTMGLKKLLIFSWFQFVEHQIYNFLKNPNKIKSQIFNCPKIYLNIFDK